MTSEQAIDRLSKELACTRVEAEFMLLDAALELGASEDRLPPNEEVFEMALRLAE